MIRRLLLRLGAAFATACAICTLVFLLIHLVPGDPIDVLLGEQAGTADREGLRKALELDRPLAVQFARYCVRLAHGDLGHSLHSREPVTLLLAQRLPQTALLAAAALVTALLLALPLGVAAAAWENRAPDHLSAGVALLGGALPGFVLGPLLVAVFAVQLGWLPVGGSGHASHLVLPALTLGLGLAAVLARQLRGALLETFAQPYMVAATARGLSRAACIRRHALRNAALPVLTLLGMQIGGLLGGTVITETVFAWPGLGTLTLEAIERRDYPLLQGCVLVLSAIHIVVNAATDLACAWCDPRGRETA